MSTDWYRDEYPKTFRGMAELVARHQAQHHGVSRTPQEVYAYSPTGELIMLWEWCDEAVIHEHELTSAVGSAVAPTDPES